MKSKAIALMAGMTMFAASSLHAQIKPLVKVVGSHYENGMPTDMAILEDGSTVIVGDKKGASYWTYAFLAIVNVDGSTRKEIIVDGTSEGGAKYFSILVEPGTGCFYVGGTTMLRTGKYASVDGADCADDICLAKYDRNGNEIWFRNLPWDQHQDFGGMGFTADGNISISFSDRVFAPIEDFMVKEGNVTYLRFDFGSPDNNLVTQREFTCVFSTEGEVQGVHEFFPPYELRSNYAQYVSAGDGTFWYFMYGMKRKKTEDNACYPHLYRLSETGEVLAEHLIAGATGMMIEDMMVLQDGNLLLSVHMFGTGGEVGKSGAHLFCFDKEANIVWMRNYYSDFEQPHIQSTETPEGDIISVMYTPGNVAEFADLPKSRCKMLCTKLTADGKDIWKKTILGLAHYQGNEAIEYHNGEVRIAVTGAQSTDNGLPPDHKVHYYSFKDF
jgi:hypothetical protein